MIWLVAVGLVSLLGQVVLLRELLVAFYGSELSVLLGLGTLMAGTALGALAGRRAPQPRGSHIRVLFLVFATLLPLLVAFLRSMRHAFGGTPGSYLPFSQQLLGLSFTCLAFGACTGLLFRGAVALWTASGRTLASAYALESLGGALGGGLATLLQWVGVQDFAATVLCSLAAVIVACTPGRDGRPRWLAPTATIMGVLLMVVLASSGRIDRALTGLDHPGLLAVRDTPYGRVAMVGSDGQVALFQNGVLAYESQGTAAEEFVHIPALFAPDPRAVLILGGLAEGLVLEILRHSPQRVDVVELDGDFMGAVAPLLPEGVRASLSAPAVHITVADPRRFLESRTRAFDLILVAMPEPNSGQANRYFTREFFGLCKAALTPSGVLACRLPSAENRWSPALAARNASIHKALAGVFSHTIVLPGTASLFLASGKPLQRDPAVLADRLKERRIMSHFISPPYLGYILTNDRVEEIARLLEGTPSPVNTDARPACYANTLVLWLSRFFPAAGNLKWPEVLLRGDIPWGFLGGAAGGWALLGFGAWKSRRARALLLVWVAGFGGMVLEGAILLGYQSKCGALYQDLGILLCVFMAGLGVGAAAADRRGRRCETMGRGLAILGVMGAVACCSAWILGHEGRLGLFGAAASLAALGGAVGGAFAFASAVWSETGGEGAGPLYAADLLGGTTGALFGGLFLLPVLGLPSGATLVALLALASLPLLAGRISRR
jgi:spermidine synthase